MEPLNDLIRQALSAWGRLTHWQVLERINGVRFRVWFQSCPAEFFVNQRMRVFEMRGNYLYITTASKLLQVLLYRVRREELRKARSEKAAAQSDG